MDFLINVSFHQPANQQAEAVLDTVGKAIQYQDYKERLTPYAIGVRQQFTEPPIDLTNHLRDTLKSAEVGGHSRLASAIRHVIQLLEQ